MLSCDAQEKVYIWHIEEVLYHSGLFIACHIFTAVRDVPIKFPPYHFTSGSCRLNLGPGKHCSLKKSQTAGHEPDCNISWISFSRALPCFTPLRARIFRFKSKWLGSRYLVRSKDNYVSLMCIIYKCGRQPHIKTWRSAVGHPCCRGSIDVSVNRKETRNVLEVRNTWHQNISII